MQELVRGMPFRRHAGASYSKPSSLHALVVIELFYALLLLVVEGREAAGIAQGRHLLADSVCSSRESPTPSEMIGAFGTSFR